MKKQLELDKTIQNNGICFITSLWNMYPEIFNYDEDKLRVVIEELKDKDLDIAEYIQYFNNYTKHKYILNHEYFDKTNSTYNDFDSFLKSKKQELLILTLNSNYDISKMHSVNIIEYNGNDVLYFENGRDNVILDYMINGLIKNITDGNTNGLDNKDIEYLSENRKKRDVYEYIKNKYSKLHEKYTEINSKLLYESSHQLIFVWVETDKKTIANFSSRLSILSIPSMGSFINNTLQIPDEYWDEVVQLKS